MKIISPKMMILLLIIIFLIVNFFFLIDFLLTNGIRIKSKTQTPNEYLKRLIDFNNTTFERKGNIYFYNNLHKQSLPKIINYTNTTSSFYLDEDNNIIIDQYNKICNINDFDLNKCIISITYDKSLCIDKLKCCSKEYICVHRCRLENNDQSCENKCKETIYTKLYETKYCYYNKIQELDYKIVASPQ